MEHDNHLLLWNYSTGDVLSFFAESYKLMKIPYSILFAIMLLVFCLYKSGRHISTIVLLYISYGVLSGKNKAVLYTPNKKEME